MAKSNRPRSTKSHAPERRAQARVTAPLLGDDDPPPDDIHEFRFALARKIMTLLGLWRRCREPACRRGKRCAGPDLRCQRDFPAPPMTPEQEARALAEVSHALKRHAELRS
jgi:hypothetical protein